MPLSARNQGYPVLSRVTVGSNHHSGIRDCNSAVLEHRLDKTGVVRSGPVALDGFTPWKMLSFRSWLLLPELQAMRTGGLGFHDFRLHYG